jgi:hypothetical protein
MGIKESANTQQSTFKRVTIPNIYYAIGQKRDETMCQGFGQWSWCHIITITCILLHHLPKKAKSRSSWPQKQFGQTKYKS